MFSAFEALCSMGVVTAGEKHSFMASFSGDGFAVANPPATATASHSTRKASSRLFNTPGAKTPSGSNAFTPVPFNMVTPGSARDMITPGMTPTDTSAMHQTPMPPTLTPRRNVGVIGAPGKAPRHKPARKSTERRNLRSATRLSKNQSTERRNLRSVTRLIKNQTPIGTVGPAWEASTLADVLTQMGQALMLLFQYRCKDALALLETLPANHSRTGWVLQHIAKAHFENNDYRKAEESFKKMRKQSPQRTAGLELYSTCLWHLRKQVELSFLAQDAMGMNKRRPEPWCVLGNCFSVQKDHESALKFFKRSLQVNSNFVYAHTLCGHEYQSNEDFEKAVACYRKALEIHPRHYKAWYGMGTIYLRQEKYQMAEYHFRRAVRINPRNSVLFCYMGMVRLHEAREKR